MPRPHRRAGLLVTAAVTATLTAATLSPSSAAPPAPGFGPVIEGLARYDGQNTCSPTAKPGTAALRALLMAAYRSTGDLGIVRACSIGGTSEHKEGRAWDWAVSVANPTQEAAAQNFFTWVLATDRYGNPYAMARRLGIMYMIHNRQIWSAYNSAAGWRPYTGPNPHTDHVHFSLSRIGGAKGTTYWTPATSGTPAGGPVPPPPAQTGSPIDVKWAALGGTAVLGRATTAEYAVPGGRARNFVGGRILWSLPTGAHYVRGGILAKYLATGGPAALGLPTTDETAVAGGRASRFTAGHVLWSPQTGAHVVRGGILTKYLATGGPAALGLPTTDETDVTGGRASAFGRGRILWSGPTGAHVVRGGIGAKYAAVGGPDTLGLPTTDELPVEGGRSSVFERGRVYWSGGTGAHVVRKAILRRYLSVDGPSGSLGLPTTDEQPVRIGLRSSFQSGRIVYDALTGRTYLHADD